MSDPLLGINSPNRLLREQWKTPVDLAQELYAMFTAKGPREIRDTLTIRVPEGRPALRVVREPGDTIINEGGHSFAVNKAAPTGPGRAFPVGRRNRPEIEPIRRREPAPSEDSARARGEDAAPRGESASFRFPTSPDVEFEASAGFAGPVTFERTFFKHEPLFLDRATGRARSLDELIEQSRGKPFLSGGADAAVYGAVVADEFQVGAEVRCHLFAKDWDTPVLDPATKQPIVATVKIPSIAADEQIPKGMSFFPVLKFGGEYWTQPAVWGP